MKPEGLRPRDRDEGPAFKRRRKDCWGGMVDGKFLTGVRSAHNRPAARRWRLRWRLRRLFAKAGRASPRPDNPWGCWRPPGSPLQHPHIPEIADVACGFDERLVDNRCRGCHRSRAESPVEQLAGLGGVGDAARPVS